MRSKAALRFSRQTANSCDETSEIDDGAKGCESTAYEKTPSPAAGCGCRAAFGMCAGARAGQADRDQSQRDRKSVVSGKSVTVRVDLGGRRNIKKKNKRVKSDASIHISSIFMS